LGKKPQIALHNLLKREHEGRQWFERFGVDQLVKELALTGKRMTKLGKKVYWQLSTTWPAESSPVPKFTDQDCVGRLPPIKRIIVAMEEGATTVKKIVQATERQQYSQGSAVSEATVRTLLNQLVDKKFVQITQAARHNKAAKYQPLYPYGEIVNRATDPYMYRN
jgi:hypothetical protein